MTLKAKQILEPFRNEDEAFIRDIYVSVKPRFMAYIIKEFNVSSEECLDLYQDSFCVFYKKIMSGAITELTSEVETLLIGIGRNLTRNKQRKKAENLMEDLPDSTEQETPFSLLVAKMERYKVRDLLRHLGADCRKVLVLFYYAGLSMNDIAKELSYANANVAKKKKYQCLRKLKSKVNQKSWN